jgi:hypothetical protein
VSLAVVAVAAVIYKGQAFEEASPAGEMSVLRVQATETPAPEMPPPTMPLPEPSMPVAQTVPQQPAPPELDALSETPQETSDFNDESRVPEMLPYDGSDEIVIPED